MKFFCKENVNPLLTIAGFDAGYLLVKNSPDMKGKAEAVAAALLVAMDGATTSEALNAMFKEAVAEWASHLSDPLIQMNVMAILSMVQIDLNVPDMPSFSTPELKAMVTGFKNGMAAVR